MYCRNEVRNFTITKIRRLYESSDTVTAHTAIAQWNNPAWPRHATCYRFTRTEVCVCEWSTARSGAI